MKPANAGAATRPSASLKMQNSTMAIGTVATSGNTQRRESSGYAW